MQIAIADKTITVQRKSIKAALSDPKKSATVVHLHYVKDGDKGIQRIKKGKSFSYTKNGRAVKDAKTLDRIKSLVIPPAWKDVWICDKENGHLQCTGIDVRGRKQYRYHPAWNALRKETKYYRLLEFGEALSSLRKKVNYHLGKQGLSKERVLAAIVATMDMTGIRVGGNLYEKLYGSYGLSTMQDKHITIKGNKVQFSFKGKKGVYQDISMKSARLAKIIRQCKDIPGKELFQYLDEAGKRHDINSEDVNNYIKDISGGEFTSKDFRTWSGTVHCIECLLQKEKFETKKQLKADMVEALDYVAKILGNTRAVCKSHYVHPSVFTLYEEGRLLKLSGKRKPTHFKTTEVEAILMKILKTA